MGRLRGVLLIRIAYFGECGGTVTVGICFLHDIMALLLFNSLKLASGQNGN